jgi:hypothetical protein
MESHSENSEFVSLSNMCMDSSALRLKHALPSHIKVWDCRKYKVLPHFVIILPWGGTESAVYAPLSQKFILVLAYSGRG